MKLRDLYSKPIERNVNPAVSATKFDPETQRIEIEEYVFTDEIINGLTKILSAIKNNKPYEHIGIWIDGYYGSGKSHFLKYLDYCFKPETRESALTRLLYAIQAIDPMDEKHQLDQTSEYNKFLATANWFKTATIDTCIFNLETSYDTAIDRRKAFLHIFWNEFNGKRGFNKFNLALAQHLEKPLQEKGVFEDFKKAILDEGVDWSNPSAAADLIDAELGSVLDIASKLAPSLDRESIRNRIVNKDNVVSIDRFAEELKSYLKNKDDNYRLIFLADEVSQFINKERDRYLNLQEIITKLSEACDNKIWVACTAQQDLSEILDDCNVQEETDKEGKIKGRFEVKVSLKGTQPEVITQKRILDKKEDVKYDLEQMFKKYESVFNLQFKLPTTYDSYPTKEDFIAYYPFVPYQFKLIMHVFNSFLNLGYVAKEVKGNERSIIKVIHSTAKSNADQELGKFVSFDELYNNMFEEGLQARGQKAIDNAIRMAKTYDNNPVLAKRVVNALFMVCNIAANDQLLFPATLDNITTLLINDIEKPRLAVKNDVEKILEFLCNNNIIRREQGKDGREEYYSFYSEEEMKVAELIKNQTIDNTQQSEILKDIFNRYLSDLKNKVQYKTRSFAVQLNVKGRNYLSNTPDIVVDFVTDKDYDNESILALNNPSNKMVYFLAQKFADNTRLRNDFFWFCKVSRYMKTPVTTEENKKTRDEFSKRASEMYVSIETEFRKILDTCPIVSGTNIIDESELGTKRGNERFSFAMQKHLGYIYPKAAMVDNAGVPKNTEDLKKAILRPVNPGDYDGLGASLTTPENEIEIYLNKQFDEVNVSEVLTKFAKAPYGWDNICTLYFINELVRRHSRDYSYSNNPNVEVQTVAKCLVSEYNKFSLRQAKALSQQLVTDFCNSWKTIFNSTNLTFTTTDSTQIFRTSREDQRYGLQTFINSYRKTELQYAKYPFIQPIRDAVEMFENWMEQRDPENYFKLVILEKDKASKLLDTCKEVTEFINDQFDKYKDLLEFVRANYDNFNFVSDDLKADAETLKNLENQEWPINIRQFGRIKDNLEGDINKVREEEKGKVKKVYTTINEQLETICAEEGVPDNVLSSIDVTIQLKCNQSSIAMLRSNQLTDDYYQEQVNKILAAKPKPATPITPPSSKKTVKVSTRHYKIISNETEVEAYLDSLRQKMMKEINNGNNIEIE